MLVSIVLLMAPLWHKLVAHRAPRRRVKGCHLMDSLRADNSLVNETLTISTINRQDRDVQNIISPSLRESRFREFSGILPRQRKQSASKNR